MGYLWVNVLTALLRRFVPCSDVQNEYSPLYHKLYRIIRMIFLCPRQFLYIPAYAMIFHSITSHNIPLYPIIRDYPIHIPLFSHENIPLLSHYCPWIFDWPIVTTISIKYPLSELTIVTDILTIIITILRPILDTLQKVKFLAGS